jgi:1-acyl-sn-glycerol-3-phosphate acyltransferase
LICPGRSLYYDSPGIRPEFIPESPVHAMNDVLESATAPPQRFERSTGRTFLSVLCRRYFYQFISGVYFQRITLLHRERLPDTGPVLYLGLHRNGAVDGFVYHRALNAPVFLISTQLRKNRFARLFFDGIAVTRTKDEGDRKQNEAALRQCVEHLQAGGRLFVFPEGTSSLGRRHLPFKSGAVWLLLDYLEGTNPPLAVIPVGIYYECPWAFRAKVEVVPGRPIPTDLPAVASRMERLKILKRRVQAALEEVGVNVASDEFQEQIQRAAYVATLRTPRSYFKSLKAMERAVPEPIADQWRKLEPEMRHAKLWFHQGVPLFPAGPMALYALAFVISAPIVAAALLCNLPPIAAGWYAGRKFPDDRNVISLWKILVGVPAFAAWITLLAVAMLLLRKIWWLLAYAAITWLGLKLYYRFKKLAVAVHNGLRHPALRPEMLKFHQTVLQSLPDETE